MFKIEYPFKKEILACGAQTQSGFCLTKKNCAFVINNLSNLRHVSLLEHYQHEIERLREELKIKPKVITHDLHPEYSSTKYAQCLGQKMPGLRLISVQHHQAHIASCIGENGIKDRIIGVVFDNGGWGEDGQLWGGEFFVGDVKSFKRVAHLEYTSLTGNSSSIGRLFDAVCALVGLRDKVDYEGQGVVELERIVNRSSHVAGKTYEFTLKQDNGKISICPEPIFEDIEQDLRKNISKSIISAVFHNTIVEMVIQLCHKIKRKEKIKDVILTGNVFQNKLLHNRLKDLLSRDGFKVIGHRSFSCNDSNIAFGQAVLANQALA